MKQNIRSGVSVPEMMMETRRQREKSIQQIFEEHFKSKRRRREKRKNGEWKKEKNGY